MREILFRGRSLKRDEWFYGDFQYHNGMNPHKGYIQHRIPHPVKELNPTCHLYPVDVETIGQFTGLLDKNGKKIFEGDILKCAHCGEIRSAIFDERMAAFEFNSKDPVDNPDGSCLCADHDAYKIIGNIYDNPELLEVE